MSEALLLFTVVYINIERSNMAQIEIKCGQDSQSRMGTGMCCHTNATRLFSLFRGFTAI